MRGRYGRVSRRGGCRPCQVYLSVFPRFLSLSPHLTPLPHVPSSFPSQPHSPRIVKTSAPLQENIHRCPPLLHPRLSHPNPCLLPPFPLLCPQNLASPHAHQKQNLMVSGLPLIPSGGISYHTHTHTQEMPHLHPSH